MADSPWELEPDTLSPWQDNPEAFTGTPTGAAQVAPDVAAAQQEQAAGGPLSPWNPVDFTSAAQSWFGGRNVEGERNGWDSDFYRKMDAQTQEWEKKAQEAGSPSLYFQRFNTEVNKEATGIAFWDDPASKVRAGDVFEDGKKVSNLIDDFGWRDAATMMAPFLLDGVDQKQAFEAGDVGDNTPLIRDVQAEIAKMTEQVQKAPTAEAFQDLLAEKRDEYDDNSAAGSTAAGAGATAAIGAGIGTLFLPGVGTAIGAGVGAAFGGIAGFLNRDQITEQVSRMSAEVDIADASGADYQGLIARVRGWSGVASTAASPLQNTVQGLYDMSSEGGLGDGVAAFYATDSTGARVAPGSLELVNLAATAGDMFAQFAGAPGRALYFATMGTQVGAGVAQLTTGDQFDPTAGRYRDMQGAGEWAAAIGSVGIDAVQLGVARALTRSARGQRALEGDPLRQTIEGNVLSRAVQRTQNVGAAAGEGVTRGIDRAWALARGKKLPENYTTKELYGYRFFFGADASAPVAYRTTAQMIAPSEWGSWMRVGFRSRARMAAAQGMPNADDVFQAALGVARDSNKMGAAVMNAFGEAKEEGAQAYLDPITYGEAASFGDVARASAMGFASGFGMSFGAALQAPAAQRLAQNQARRTLEAVAGRKLTNEEWGTFRKTNSPEMLEAWAAADDKELGALGAASAAASGLLEYENGTTTVIGRQALEVLSEVESKQWERSLPQPGGTVIARPRTNTFLYHRNLGTVEDAEFAANEAVFSLWRVAEVLRRKAEIGETFANEAAERLAAAQEQLTAAQASGDTVAEQRWTTEVSEITSDLLRMQMTQQFQVDVAEQLARYQQQFVKSKSAAERAQIVSDVNEFLRFLGQGRNGDGTEAADAETKDMFMRGVELLFGRHPFMDSGSFVRFVPQVSLVMSEMNQHAELHLPQTSMKVLGLDFDGDFMQYMNSVYMSPSALRAIRLGGQYMKPVDDGRYELVMDPPDSEEKNLSEFRQYYLNPTGEEATFLDQEIDKMGDWVKARYGPVLGTAEVDAAWEEFKQQVQRGNQKARIVFTERLINLDAEKFLRMGEQDAIPEANLLMERFTFMWERAGMKIAAFNHVNLEVNGNLSPAAIAQHRQFIRENPALMAATYGAAIAITFSQDGQRSAQQMNYLAFLRSGIKLGEYVDQGAVLTDVQVELSNNYATIDAPSARSPLEEVEATDIVFSTVRDQLLEAARDFQKEQGTAASKLAGMPLEQVALLIGSLSVPAHHRDTDGTIVMESGNISILQMLLRVSVQQEAARLALRREAPTTPASMALQKARRLSEAGEKHSYTAYAAMREVFAGQTLSSLLGDSHALLGPDTTLDAFVTSLTARHESVGRAAALERITKASPLWESGIPDPPFSLEQLLEGNLSPYVLIANMTRAIVNNNDNNIKRRDEKATENAVVIFGQLMNYIQAHTDEVSARMRLRDPKVGDVSQADVLAELLTYDQTLAQMVVQLMQVESLRATFVRNTETNQIVAAKWVNAALLQTGPHAAAKAAKMFLVYSKLDHMRLLSRGYPEVGDDATDEEQLDAAGKAAMGIPFEKLTSRIEQTIMYAELEASKGNPWPKLELHRAFFQTNSTDEMMDIINSSPWLRGDRAPLRAYFDDVADFEMRPGDMYRKSLPSASMREQFALVRERLDTLVPAKQREVVQRRAEESLYGEARARLVELGGSFTRTNNPATLNLQPKPIDTLLWRILERIEAGAEELDGVGPTSRDRAMESIFEGLQDLADKGKGDKNVALVGGSTPLVASFGLAPGIDQETDNITRFDPRDVMSNLSKLFEGPVEVGLDNGAWTTVDMTSVAGVVKLLSSSATNSLARVALTPQVYDASPDGSVQLYSMYDTSEGIESLLDNASGASIFARGTRPDTASAHRFLSLVESRTTKAAQTLPDPKKRQAHTLQVQYLLHDLLVMNALGPMKGPRGAALRDKLVQDVAQAQIELSQLAPELRPAARQRMIDMVIDKLEGTTLLSKYHKLPAEFRELMDDSVKTRIEIELQGRITELEFLLPTLTDPIQQAEVEAEINRLIDVVTDSTASIESLLAADQRRVMSMLRAREMFAIDWSSDETAQASAKRVMDFLMSGSRILRFNQPKVGTLYDNVIEMGRLYDESARTYVPIDMLGATDEMDLTPEKSTQKQWAQVSEWAARAYVEDASGPADPTIGSTANVSDQDNAYYGQSYEWIVEQLFDDAMLDQAAKIAERVGFNKDNSLEINVKDVVERTVNNLFDDRQVGPWSRLIPQMATKARKALAVTPVELAIPMHGDNPMNKADEMGASWATYELPGAEHTSTHVITGTADTTVRSVLAATPEMLLKLENHFVSEITITDSAGKIPVTFEPALPDVGRLGLASDEIEKSPYRVMSLRRLQERIEMLKEQFKIDDYTITITYVDVDKLPYDEKWANNVFFEGLGRGYETSGIQSLVASLFFSTGAINKEGQQKPLEYSKSADSGFLAYIMGPRGRGKQLRAQAASVTEAMKLLALELMKHTYETGALLTDDIPSIHKLMKMRHLVRRNDADGKSRIMTVDEAISLEQAELLEVAAGTRKKISTYVLIPLTGPQARSFWAGNTPAGLPGVYMGSPVLNPQDVSPFPQVTQERLERAGLTELGRRVPVYDTVFAQVRLQPMATKSELDPLPSAGGGLRFLVRPDQGAAVQARFAMNNFNIVDLTKKHVAYLQSVFRRNRGLTKMLEGTSVVHALNPRGNRLSEVLAEADALPESSAHMLWLFEDDESTRTTDGVLTAVDMRNEFGWKGTDPLKLLWGDVVVVDVGSIIARFNGDPAKAYERGQEVLRALAQRGARISLSTSTGGGTTTLNDLAAWINEGGLLYQRVAGSPHFYEPVTKELAQTATDKALRRSLSDWSVYTGRGAQAALVVADEPLTDGAGYANYDNMENWNTEVVGVFANHLSHIGPTGGREFTFGLATNTEQDPNVVARLKDDLLGILESKEGWKQLGVRDPKGVPRRRVVTTKDGVELIEPGIVSAEDARQTLIQLLKSSRQDLYSQRTLRAGDFVPYITSRGDIILHRYGFEIPKSKTIARVMNGEPVKYPGGTRGLHVVVPEAKIEQMATIPPDFFIEQLFRTGSGVRATGRARLDKSMKGVLQVIGAKIGFTEMPPQFEPALERLSLLPDNNFSVNFVIGAKSIIDKGGNKFFTDNFSDAAAFFGISFRQDLMDYFGLNWDETKQVLRTWSRLSSEREYDEDALVKILQLNQFGEAMANEIIGVFGKTIDQTRLDEMTSAFDVTNEDPTRRIVQVVLAAMLLPNVGLEQVLETTGLLNVERLDSNEKILRMPRFMSIVFDDKKHYPKTFELLRSRMNSRVARNAEGVPVLELNSDWTVSYTVVLPGDEFKTKKNPKGLGRRRGKLQYIIPVPAQQNVATYEQRYVLQRLGNTSQYVSALVSGALGGRVLDMPELTPGKPKKNAMSKAWHEGLLYTDLSSPELFSPVFSPDWFNAKDPSFDRWSTYTYRELAALRDGSVARAQYLQPIDENSDAWKQDPLAKSSFDDLARRVLEKLNLTNVTGSRLLLHQLIRMDKGIAGPSKDQDATVGFVTLQDALEALQSIMDNLEARVMPTMGGVQSLMHADTYRMIFDAQQRPGVTTPWRPKVSLDGNTAAEAETWEDWLRVAFATALENGDPFSAMDEAALNGFWQTYLGVSPITGNLTVTFDAMGTVALRSATAEGEMRDLVLIGGAEALNSPMLVEGQNKGLDSLTGKAPRYGREGRKVYESRDAFHARRKASWRARRDMTRQDPKQNIADLRRNAARYLENSNAANVAFRNLSLWSLVNRMFNFGIYTSALIEVPVRKSHEYLTNLVLGESLGVTGKATSKMPGHALTSEEVALLEDLIKQLGSNGLLLAEIQNQLTYTILGRRARGISGFSEKLEDFAGWMTRVFADPWSGMKGDSLVREYIGAVVREMYTTDSVISIEDFVRKMKNDPLWVKHNFPEEAGGLSPHKAGMNRVAQVRSMKPTMLSLPFTRTFQGMMESPRVMTNIGGHLLHMQFMFVTFNANALTTLTGMAGWDQAVAMFFSGRRKPKFLRSKANRPLGDAGTERWDFTDVLETVDLQRTFIRSDITFSMLMALGMMAGNLGLDGDDEEMRRRERLTRYLNIPLINDPYEPANNFKFANAIFLDSIPILNNFFKQENGQSVVIPHWTIRQFTSPILGMQRFFDTGDLREIAYGFQDALSVIPNSITRTFEQANVLAASLADQASNTSREDTIEARGAVNQLVVNIVTAYEKVLFENQFINTLYTASDEFDRDPYAIPLTKNKVIQREDSTNLPLRSKTLQATRDAEGAVDLSYDKRTAAEALPYAYTENNLTAAIVMSLFSGKFGESDYLRQNMVVKQRFVEMPETSEKEAEALILAAYTGAGGNFALNKDELIRLIKTQAESADVRWEQAAVEKQADAILAAHSPELAMSKWTEEYGEVITESGAEALYRSLWSGSIELGSPALRGIAIPVEMREKVAANLVRELVQDGVDAGLSYQTATYVAKRIWYGDQNTPNSPGMNQLLRSKEIPYNNRVPYNQLNVLYAIGPDGRPWATPFERSTVAQALGLPMPHQMAAAGPGTHLDKLGNVVDDVLGINTGISGVVRTSEPEVKLADPFKKLPATMTAGGGNGGRSWGRRGGYSGGGGSSYGPPFQRMYELPFGTSARFGGIPMINTSNPYIRRAEVNRERVFGERGRLKQWQ